MHKLTCLLAAALWLAATPRVHAQVCENPESWGSYATYFLTTNSFTAGVNEARCVTVPERLEFEIFPRVPLSFDVDIIVEMTYDGETPPGWLRIEDAVETRTLVSSDQALTLRSGVNRITVIPRQAGQARIFLTQDGGSFGSFPLVPGGRSFTVLANPAPVTWTRPLTSAPAGPDLELSWGVAEQVNVAGYTLERQNGADWEALHDIAYVGNGAAEVVYTTRTPRPTGDAYYRIRQTDFDGSHSLSNVVFVPGSGAASLALFPNPASGSVRFTAPAEAERLTVSDLTGRTVTILSGADLARGSVELATLPAGMYVVSAYGRRGRLATERLVVR